MTTTQCSYCNYSYDEWSGDARNGVPAGIPIEELAGTVCSRCGLQGERHEGQPNAIYKGLEADLFDQFAGKAGISFYRSWVEQSGEPVTVLEAGVGTGRLAAELAPIVSRYCGVDWSPDMLKLAEAKRKRVLPEAESRLELVESDFLQFAPHEPESYSHVLLSDGFLQHYTTMEEHQLVLRHVHGCLKSGGRIAVDIRMPPAAARWEAEQRKRVSPNKLAIRRTEGETSLVRQLYRCAQTYSVYIDGAQESVYRTEREYALLTPKEAALLLAVEGYQLESIHENYGGRKPWKTALPSGLQAGGPSLGAKESIDEALAAGKLVETFRPGYWTNGGFPLDGTIPSRSSHEAAQFTLIATKI